ncbi:kinase-like protein [Gigaspora margarita]|uniref:Kinase-like protein n=1 Tax=Gigaspora margarita TaxID=4874 RepID=A0A8H3XIE9_GIGMA|nr:kinase-like protein [Gigaspora margarita]
MSDWYERAVKDEYIKSFEYESFKNWKHIGKGGFGTVYSAYSEDIDQTIALKSLNDNLIDENKFYEFVREVRNIIKVHHHINIIQFFGFTKDTTTENGTSYMVLQFANNGDLRSYLLDHFSELNWSSKIEMAKDISNGIKCLHKANIVHRDLHDKNILVDNGRLMIADFGLGVLFWELSSGVPPFKNMTGETSVAIKIISGKREDPINGTPIDFMNLYCDAWNGDPNSRPNIAEICNKINTIQLFPVYNSIKPTLVESNPAIERESINSFEFKSFKNVEHIGKGGFGDIVSADSEDMGQTVALKCYTKASYNDIVREVKIITKVHHHANIIRFFGITKNPETEKYYMVLQFANNAYWEYISE